MANIKLTELDAITTLASADVLAAVDVSADETHKITAANLFRTLPDGTAAAPALAFSSDQANGVYLAGTDTVGISTGGTQRVTVDGSGNVTISGDLTVSGATTTVESTTVTIDDKNIELGSVASPSNTTADGGGITLKGATDKEIKWINSTGYWTFNTGIEVGGHLQIDDSNEIRVGTGQDLKIYHDATNSFIENSNGNFNIKNLSNDQDITLQTDDGSGGAAVYVRCDGSEGKVVLYHLGNEKLNTKSDGVNVTGEVQCDSLDVDGVVDITGNVTLHANLDLQDNDKILLGTGDDAQIYHDGTNSFVAHAGPGQLFITNETLNQDVVLRANDGAGFTTYVQLDSSAGEVKINHAGSLKLATKSTGIDVTGEVQCDSLDVDGGFNIDGSQITYDASSNIMKFTDNAQLRFGGGNDYRFYHNATNSYIENYTGNLYILNASDDKDIYLQSDDGSGGTATYIQCDGSNGEVRLFHYGSEKLNTKSDGIDVTGEVQCDSLDVDGNGDISGYLTIHGGGLVASDFTFDGQTAGRDIRFDRSEDALEFEDNAKAMFGTSNDLRIYHDGHSKITNHAGHLYIDQDAQDGNIYLRSDDGSSGLTDYIQCNGSNGEVKLYHYGSQKLNTKSDGIGVTGAADISGNISLGGTDATINFGPAINRGIIFQDTSTGFLNITGRSGYGAIFNVGSTEAMRLDSSGRLMLGTTTEGQANADNLTIADSGECGITIRSGTTNNGSLFFSDTTSGTAEYSGYVQYDHNVNTLYFGTNSTQRLAINSNGAWGIEGASNYGTSGQVLTSNGNDSPTWQDAGSVTVGGATAISMNDNVKINFGNSSDLQIFHNGSNSEVLNNTGDLFVKNNTNDADVVLQTDNGSGGVTNYVICDGSSGQVKICHYGTEKFSTRSGGVNVVGEVECDSLDVDGSGDITGTLTLHGNLDMQDEDRIIVGSGNDLEIYHDGNTRVRHTGAGDLLLQSNSDVYIQRASDGHQMIIAENNGPVKLYYDNSQKFATTSTGVDVTGSITCDGLVVDGTFTQSNGTGLLTIQDDNNTGNATLAYIQGSDSGNSQKWYIGHASTNNQDLYINNNAGGQIRFRSSNADRIIMQAAGHFVPQTNNSIDLGSSSNRWRNVYTNDLNLSNEGSTNDVDGTWGNYTIQEGEDDLFLINRRNGKKYKFNLTEVS